MTKCKFKRMRDGLNCLIKLYDILICSKKVVKFLFFLQLNHILNIKVMRTIGAQDDVIYAAIIL